MKRTIPVWKLKVGDRFSEIPAAWHGPGVVTESSGTRTLLQDASYNQELPLCGKKRVAGCWTIKFNNNKVVNPPGVLYLHPETKVRLLSRKGRL